MLQIGDCFGAGYSVLNNSVARFPFLDVRAAAALARSRRRPRPRIPQFEQIRGREGEVGRPSSICGYSFI